MFTLVSLCSATVIRLYCWSVFRREVRWSKAGTSCVRMSWSRQDFRKQIVKHITFCNFSCDNQHPNRISVKSFFDATMTSCYTTPIKLFNWQLTFQNLANFVAVETQLDARQFFLTHFFLRSPPWRWLCAPCGSLCASPVFSFHPSTVFFLLPLASLVVICWN